MFESLVSCFMKLNSSPETITNCNVATLDIFNPFIMIVIKFLRRNVLLVVIGLVFRQSWEFRRPEKTILEHSFRIIIVKNDVWSVISEIKKMRALSYFESEVL